MGTKHRLRKTMVTKHRRKEDTKIYIYEISVHDHETSIDTLYNSLYFLISTLHCFFANVTPCPLVLHSSLTDKKYFFQYFHTHSIFKHFHLISSQSPVDTNFKLYWSSSLADTFDTTYTNKLGFPTKKFAYF